MFRLSKDVAANGEGLVLRARAISREGRGEVLGGHASGGNDGEIDTHTPVSVTRTPRDEVKQLVISDARLGVGPGDAHESGPAVEHEPHLLVKILYY